MRLSELQRVRLSQCCCEGHKVSLLVALSRSLLETIPLQTKQGKLGKEERHWQQTAWREGNMG